MARKTKDTETGTLKIRATQIPIDEAMQGAARAGRLFGPSMTVAGELAKYISLFANFADADFLWLRERFLKNSKRVYDVDQSNGATTERLVPLGLESFEETDDPLSALMTWFTDCVALNFASFFQEALSSGRPPETKTQGASTSPTDSTGGSGDAS